MKKIGNNVVLSVKKKRSKKDFLYIQNTNQGFCLFYNDRFLAYSYAKKRAFLLHECFHVFQYTENFPMLLCDTKRKSLFLVQHIITDLYVSKHMRAAGFKREAQSILSVQVRNIGELFNSRSPIERILRLSLMLSENSLFEHQNNEQMFALIEKKTSSKELQKIKEIVNIILREYENNDVHKMYKSVMALLFPKIVLYPFDNMIIVQEKKCLK